MEQNNNISLLKKYECKSLSQVVGNQDGINLIKNWLTNYYTSKKFLLDNGLLKKSSKGRKKKMTGLSEKDEYLRNLKGNLLVIGGHGTGKTMIINLILKELGYDIYYFSNFINKDKINTNRMYDKHNKSALVIDELESIIILNDKKSVSTLITENNYKRTIPIIVITNNSHYKQVNETEKHSDSVRIFSPFTNKIYPWLNKICIREGIRFEYGLMDMFIKHCKNDMRKILIELDNLKILLKNKMIKRDDFEYFIKVIDEKNMDVMLFKDAGEMMTQNTNINKCLSLYDSEKILIPLMIQQNYYEFIRDEKFPLILNIFSISDIIDTYINNGQNYHFHLIRGIMTTAIPSYLINKHKKDNINFKKLNFAYPDKKIKKKKDKDEDEDEGLDFAIDLNRTSVKKMNSKNTKTTNEEISKNSGTNNKSIDEFIYMGDIINGNPNLNIRHSNNILKVSKIK